MHPLLNAPITHLLPNQNQAQWLAAGLEFHRDLFRLQTNLEEYHRQAQANKLTSLNRLQRSLISDRVAAVSKDSTVKLASFLTSTIQAAREWLGFGFDSFETWKVSQLCALPFFFSTDTSQDRVRILRAVVLYVERTIRLSSDLTFDDAKFQAHLAQGANLFQKYLDASSASPERAFVTHLMDRLSTDFTSGFKLSTGLSMEALWHAFRPTPVSTRAILERCVELERLGVRFDALRWKAGASISDLSKAMATLEKASGILGEEVPHADELVRDLTGEIEALEARIGSEAVELKPFLASEFEALRQVSLLASLTAGSAPDVTHQELTVLSDIPTRAGMMLASSNRRAPALLQSVENLVYQNQFSWNGKFATSLWSKLENLGSVRLDSLALLEAELPIVVRRLADLTPDLAVDPIVRLSVVLWKLVVEVFNAHGDLGSAVTAAREQASLGVDVDFSDLLAAIQVDHFRQITQDHLIPVIKALAATQQQPQQQARLSAFAWIHFSIGTVKLYVPDRAFDPQSRPKMERDFFEEMHRILHDNVSALRAFEKSFTGQDTSERIQLKEEELAAMGPLPEEVQPIYRPETSELGRLQAEFANVLKAVAGPTLSGALQHVESDPARALDELKLVRENVLRLLDRLSARFEAYRDMTRPTSNLLRCLLVGLSLCEATTAASLPTASEQLVRIAPFFGGTLWDQTSSSFSAASFEFLSFVGAVVAVEGVDAIGPRARELVFECFHAFYDEWTKRLEADRKEEAAKGSLYRFRGSLEDEEEMDAEEFNELFPSFDDDDNEEATSTAPRRDEVRNQSLRVAGVHRNIFIDRLDSTAALEDVCRVVGHRITTDTTSHPNVDRSLTAKMLAGMLLLANDKMDAITSTSVPKSYSFYTSSHPPKHAASSPSSTPSNPASAPSSSSTKSGTCSPSPTPSRPATTSSSSSTRSPWPSCSRASSTCMPTSTSGSLAAGRAAPTACSRCTTP